MRISDCSSDVCSSDLLNWLNAENVPFYGDLVYPVGYEPGRRYPMVIVQYRTKGFLRGGIGDEVPIPTLAVRGYFILSVDHLTYEDIVGRRHSIEQIVAEIGRAHVRTPVTNEQF